MVFFLIGHLRSNKKEFKWLPKSEMLLKLLVIKAFLYLKQVVFFLTLIIVRKEKMVPLGFEEIKFLLLFSNKNENNNKKEIVISGQCKLRYLIYVIGIHVWILIT